MTCLPIRLPLLLYPLLCSVTSASAHLATASRTEPRPDALLLLRSQPPNANKPNPIGGVPKQTLSPLSVRLKRKQTKRRPKFQPHALATTSLPYYTCFERRTQVMSRRRSSGSSSGYYSSGGSRVYRTVERPLVAVVSTFPYTFRSNQKLTVACPKESKPPFMERVRRAFGMTPNRYVVYTPALGYATSRSHYDRSDYRPREAVRVKYKAAGYKKSKNGWKYTG